MIYVASYFSDPCYFHGKLVPISFPAHIGFNYKLEPELKIFSPSNFLRNYKFYKIPQKDYAKHYKKILKMDLIKIWLNSIKPEDDITLMIWEKIDEFSHGDLILKFVEKYKPNCYGGRNVCLN
jgi:hypothetical protein